MSSTVRRFAALAVLVGSLIAPVSAQSVAIPGLFNTGVDAAGTATLANGSQELHYTIIAGPPGFTPTAFVLSNQLVGTYFQSPNSKWIWQTAGGTPGSTTFTFRLTFNLTGLNPATARLAGAWGTDNSGFIQLNGGAQSFALTGNVAGNLNVPHPFSFNTGFVSGVNTLDFVVTDGGAPAGLNVTNLAGTASIISASAAPEPGTLILLLTGTVAGMGIRRRHIRGR
jgi:hypothetical protein